MSETFPDDVLKAAQWVNRLILAAGDREEREVTIARAIAAERERCAKTAYDGLRDGLDTPEAIAAAIRGTNA